eukprot:TRINITY_DN8641_c0_g1_i1.p1 TRINITY_DN8641_c0_g1~~TRINITY_DN8641_c0_g1_i1.p1  ORF type:complete len:607 (-),score=178.65 TRINITY_DN8641_c0_g1_i1:123-1943(-)
MTLPVLIPLLIFAIPVVLLVYKGASQTPKKIDKKAPYYLSDLAGPPLGAKGLKIFVHLLESSLLSFILVPFMFKINKFGLLRNVKLSCPPTYFPLVHATKEDELRDEANDQTSEQFLSSLSIENPTPGSILAYAAAYRNGSVTPSVVAKKVIQGITEADKGPKPLRAFISTDLSDISSQANTSSILLAEGKPRSIFEGVPIGIKDEVHVSGHPTSGGTAYIQKIRPHDATIVKRLREAGAVLIGKTNMHEIGASTIGFNPHFGVPRNPHNLAHHTGGSSSGSACAVASGMVPMAVGCDGGGSVRVPAGLCGVVGLKPTFGRLSDHGIIPIAWTVAHPGILSSCIVDCAISYAVMAGKDEHDATTHIQPSVKLPIFPPISTVKPLSGLRVGVCSPYNRHSDQVMQEGAKRMEDALVALGATIVEVELLPGLLEYARVAHTVTIISEMASSFSSYYEDHSTRSKFGLDVRLNYAIFASIAARDYLQAARIKTKAIQGMKKLFAEVDLLLTPTTGVPAPSIPDDDQPYADIRLIGMLMRYAFIGNLTGVPGLSMNTGYTPEGLPVGTQLMAGWWRESLLLRVGYCVENYFKLHNTVPSHTPVVNFKHIN